MAHVYYGMPLDNEVCCICNTLGYTLKHVLNYSDSLSVCAIIILTNRVKETMICGHCCAKYDIGQLERPKLNTLCNAYDDCMYNLVSFDEYIKLVLDVKDGN